MDRALDLYNLYCRSALANGHVFQTALFENQNAEIHPVQDVTGNICEHSILEYGNE